VYILNAKKGGIQMKKCIICGEEKEEKKFPPKRLQCTRCVNEKQKENKKAWIEKNREHIRKTVHENYLANRELVIARTKKWKEENKQKFKESWKRPTDKHPLKYAARRILNHQIEFGKIIRAEECQDCKKECKTEAHHEDYTKPLDVLWLCRQCHAYRHREFKKD
jgi:hypothetical protein